jgi:hypothetical protein
VNTPSLLTCCFFLSSILAVVVTLGFPAAIEHWTNEQVLNFVHLMWDRSKGDVNQSEQERESDPLSFLTALDGGPQPATTLPGPLEATIVVEVARKTYESLVANGVDVFSRRKGNLYEPSFGSPLAGDAIMIESPQGTPPKTHNRMDVSESENGDHLPTNQARSFVAAPESTNTKQAIPDPNRKKRIVEWLCSNIQHLNELSQLPFSSNELWRLHQHYFTPVVNESGGTVSDNGDLIVCASSVPDVSRASPGGSAVTPSTQSSEDHLSVPLSDPALCASLAPMSLPLLKRKVSYRFLGDSMITSHSRHDIKFETNLHKGPSVARIIEDGHTGNSLPPKTKRARRNRTRISFVPRIKAKLDSYLDVCHEKALIMMRQLYFVEQAILGGHVNPLESCPSPRTHLSGVQASEAEMIIVDMI